MVLSSERELKLFDILKNRTSEEVEWSDKKIKGNLGKRNER